MAYPPARPAAPPAPSDDAAAPRPALRLDHDGATLVAGAACAILPTLRALADELPPGQAGVRLHDRPTLAALLTPDGPIVRLACDALGGGARPVRAIMFDKSPGANWSLGWHQDRTICVAERIDVAGFGPWTTKQRLLHVEPPFPIIEGMLTMRVHLDAVDADRAPLLVAPRSHRLGRIAEADIAATVARCGTATCLAEPGDVWLYATAILHASASSSGAAHRRVLQVDFATSTLPGGLRWRGI